MTSDSRRSLPALVLLIAMACAPACTVDLGVSTENRVTCANDNECPKGFLCNENSQLCVSAGAEDADAPQLVGDAIITPGVARSGVVTFRFTVNEPLLISPALEFVSGGTTRGPAEVSNSEDEQPTYEFSYNVVGDESESSSPVSLTLVDRAGNTTRIVIGDIEFDFTAPLLTSPAEMELVPSESNPLDAVETARNDTTIEIVFVPTEPLASPPTLSSTPQGLALTCQGVEAVVTCEGMPTGAMADGAHQLTATLEDIAGNTSTIPLDLSSPNYPSGLIVDTTAPSPANVDDANAVLLRRNPWGTDATSAGMSLEGLCADTGRLSSVEPSAWVLAQNTGGDEIGRLRASTRGDFGLTGAAAAGCSVPVAEQSSFQLLGADEGVVHIVVVDPAGNESAPSSVRNVEWTASLVGKVPGSSVENPHNFEAQLLFDDAYLRPASVVNEIPESGLGVIGDAPVTSSNGPTWRYRTPANGPRLGEAVMAFDNARGQTVLLGGSAFCGADERTWLRTRGRWESRSPVDLEGDGDPGARTAAAMAFLPRLGRVILFGGLRGDLKGDTWSWSGQSWRRECRTAACEANTPPPREGHSLVTDVDRGTVLLFGGDDGVSSLNDLWEFDGDSWTELCSDTGCQNNRPSARAGHGMVFDRDRAVFVLHGGASMDPTWEWDRSTWNEVCTDPSCLSTRPTQLTDTTLAFDPILGETVLLGGNPPLPEFPAPMQLAPVPVSTWNGARWLDRSDTSGGPGVPSIRDGARSVWDPTAQRIMLHGGSDPYIMFLVCPFGNALAETWEWDRGPWIAGGTPDGFNPSGGHALVYDTVSSRVLLQGDLTILFSWNGLGWRALDAYSSGGPSNRRFHAMGHDRSTGKTFLYGGINNGSALEDDVWIYDGSWTQNCGACLGGGRQGVSFVYAGSMGSLLLLNGFNRVANDTWEYAEGPSNQFLQSCGAAPCAPGPVMGHAPMVYDYRQDRVLQAVGGTDDQPNFSSSVWEWTGSAWIDRSVPGITPEPRRGHAIAYDGERRAIVLFGGDNDDNQVSERPPCSEDGPCNNTWEWTDAGWREPTLLDPDLDGNPPGVMFPAAAFDEENCETVFHTDDEDTWVYDSGGCRRPAHVFVANLSAGQIGHDEILEDIRVRWLAGGDGETDTVAEPGVELFIWDFDRWVSVSDTSSAPAAAPAEVVWTLAGDPALSTRSSLERSRLLFGPSRELRLAATPRAPSGTLDDYARIATDYVEVTVRYRRPTP